MVDGKYHKAEVEMVFENLVSYFDEPDIIFFGWSNWKNCAGMAQKLEDRERGNEIYLVTVSEFYLEAFKNPEDILDTVAHELAHVAANYYNDIPMSSHGDEWKFYAKVLGARPQACFDNNPVDLDLSKFKYTASCPNPDCDVAVGFSRMGKTWRKNLNPVFKKGGYKCKKCNKKLVVKRNF